MFIKITNREPDENGYGGRFAFINTEHIIEAFLLEAEDEEDFPVLMVYLEGNVKKRVSDIEEMREILKAIGTKPSPMGAVQW